MVAATRQASFAKMTGKVSPRLLIHLAFTAGVCALYLAAGHFNFSIDGSAWSNVCELSTQFTQLDRILGFRPWWIWLYLSLWIMWFLPVYFLSWSEYRLFMAAAAACYVIAFVGFAICSDGHPRPDPAGLSPPLHLAYQLLYAIDPNRNVFPSVHAIVGTLLIWVFWKKKYGGLAALWGALVVCSSIFTKQHTIVDVGAGVLVAVIVLALGKTVERRVSRS